MRHFFLMITSAGFLACVCACTGESAEHKAATALSNSADSCMAAGDFARAISLLDSLNNAYPKEIDIRKASNLKRAKAFEGLALSQIPRLDAQLDSLNAVVAALYPDFIQEQSTSSLSPYALYKSIAGQSLTSGAGIQPRVNVSADDAADTPWSIAVNAGKNIGLNAIETVTKNGHRFRMEAYSADGQMGTVTPEAAAEAAGYLFDNPGDPAVSATLSGTRGQVNVKLNASTSQAIAESWNYACTKARLRASLVNRERVEQQLQIARDQAANAATPDNDNTDND